MKKSLSFLLSTTLLLNASLASAVDTVTVTGYRPAPGSSGSYFSDTPTTSLLDQQAVANSRMCSILPAMMKTKLGECTNQVTAYETQQTPLCDAKPESATKQISVGISTGVTLGGSVTEVYNPRAACFSTLTAQLKQQTGVCTDLKNQFNLQLAQNGCKQID